MKDSNKSQLVINVKKIGDKFNSNNSKERNSKYVSRSKLTF